MTEVNPLLRPTLNPAFYACEEMDALTKPVQEFYGANYVCYGRIYADWRMVRFSNRGDIDSQYYQRKMYCHNQFMPKLLDSGVYFLDALVRVEHPFSYANMLDFYEEHDVCHPVVIVQQYEDYMEYLLLGTPKEHPMLSLAVAGDPSVLTQLLFFIKEKACHLIRAASDNAYNYYKLLESERSPLEVSFSDFQRERLQASLLDCQRFYLGGRFDGVYLTVQEAKCLSLLESDSRYKVIANKLGCSTTTVQDHFNNIREKLGCESKQALIELCQQRNLFAQLGALALGNSEQGEKSAVPALIFCTSASCVTNSVAA